MSSQTLYLANEAATRQLAACLVPSDPLRLQGLILGLGGDLGAGKTTFCRALLRKLGCTGPVKSPTFTLVEPYQLSKLTVFHFDLYRLSHAEELEFIGIDDYFSSRALHLVEWPERGYGILPPVDICLHFSARGGGRQLQLSAESASGLAILNEAAPGISAIHESVVGEA